MSSKSMIAPNEEEFRTLVVAHGCDVGNETVHIKKSNDLCLLHRIMRKLDEQVNVKLIMRLWGPRLEMMIRLMLVATFLDDSIRVSSHFSEQAMQVGQQGYPLKWLVGTSPKLVTFLAAIIMCVGLLAQLIGSICLVVLKEPDMATKALIGWTIAQPILYAQLSNGVFVAESFSLLGGLLMLQQQVKERRHDIDATMMLLGRMLLPAVYLYDAGNFLFSALTLDETNSFVTYISSLSMFVINAVIFVGLVIGATLVAFGLKSRTVALILAILNFGYVVYQHPFFLYVWLDSNGEWKFDEHMPIPQVAVPDEVWISEFDPWKILDLHRYYFFLGLSTSSALLLLAQFGPGDIAVQKDEVLLPYVSRSQD